MKNFEQFNKIKLTSLAAWPRTASVSSNTGPLILLWYINTIKAGGSKSMHSLQGGGAPPEKGLRE